jgi:hypothetical protein
MPDLRLTEIAQRTRLSLRYWQRQAAAGKVPSARYLQCGKRRIFVVDADRFADWWARTPEDRAAILEHRRAQSVAEKAEVIRMTERVRAAFPEEIDTTSQVYFMESAGYVKIGRSRNVPKRLSEMQVANPGMISLMGLLPGGQEMETAIHAALDAVGHKRRGEWFLLTDALRHTIGEICDG